MTSPPRGESPGRVLAIEIGEYGPDVVVVGRERAHHFRVSREDDDRHPVAAAPGDAGEQVGAGPGRLPAGGRGGIGHVKRLHAAAQVDDDHDVPTHRDAGFAALAPSRGPDRPRMSRNPGQRVGQADPAPPRDRVRELTRNRGRQAGRSGRWQGGSAGRTPSD